MKLTTLQCTLNWKAMKQEWRNKMNLMIKLEVSRMKRCKWIQDFKQMKHKWSGLKRWSRKLKEEMNNWEERLICLLRIKAFCREKAVSWLIRFKDFKKKLIELKLHCSMPKSKLTNIWTVFWMQMMKSNQSLIKNTLLK